MRHLKSRVEVLAQEELRADESLVSSGGVEI